MKSEKKTFVTPQINSWGRVEDLTSTGCTNEGDDGMWGTASSNGDPPVNCDDLGGGPPDWAGSGGGPN